MKRIDGETYYFNEDGTMAVEQFVEIGEKLYYFDTDGKQVRGKVFTKKYSPEWHFAFKDGTIARNQLVLIWDTPYYFGEDGYMLRSGSKEVNGMYYEILDTGEVYIYTKWPYIDENGLSVTKDVEHVHLFSSEHDTMCDGCKVVRDVATCETFENGFCVGCGGPQSAVQVTADNYSEFGLTSKYIDYYAIANAGQLWWFALELIKGNSSMNVVLVDDIVLN